MHASAPTDLDQLIHALRDIIFSAKNGIGQQIDVVDASEEMAVIDEGDASPQPRGAIEREQAFLKDALRTVLAATAVPLPVPAGDAFRWTLRLRVAAIGLFRYAATPRPAFVDSVKVEPPRRVLKAARRLVGAIDTLGALALTLATPAPAAPTPSNRPVGDGQPQKETNARVEKYLAVHPTAKQREVAAAVGASVGAVAKAPAWRKAQESKSRYKGGAQLWDDSRAKALGAYDDPADNLVFDAEAAFANILDKADPAQRAVLHESRDAVIEYIKKEPSRETIATFVSVLLDQAKDARQRSRRSP